MLADLGTTTCDTNMGSKTWLWLLIIQGAYFAILGVWPIIDIHSFQAVTGPKTDHLPTGNERDHWLVNTVGALITVVGLTLLLAAYWRRTSAEIAFLGAASALVLMAVDVIYVYRQVIAPIYLADAGIEAVFCAAWIYAGMRNTNSVGSQETHRP
jgi:hypothetical protein